MARSRKGTAAGGDPQPIVTYSHMPPDIVDDRVEPPVLDPDATVIEAVEVPLVGDAGPTHRRGRAPDLRATDPVAGDLRADPRDDDSFGLDDQMAAAGFDPEPRRRRGRGLLAFVALVAIVGGAGAVGASLGIFSPVPKAVAPVAVSTDPAAELIAIHKQIDALGEATTPEAQAELARLTKRLAELEQSGAVAATAGPGAADASPAGEAADIGPTVRQISLTPDTSEEAAPPPSPRPRPEKLASRPASGDAAAMPEGEAPAAVRPVFPPTGKLPRGAGAPPRGPSPAAADDNFIASVEKALADSKNGPLPPPPGPSQPAMGAAASAPPAAEPLVLPAPVAAVPPQADPAPLTIAPPPATDALPALPKLDATAADPYALPAPVATTEPPAAAREPQLPPGVKLPPAEIPNAGGGGGEQY